MTQRDESYFQGGNQVAEASWGEKEPEPTLSLSARVYRLEQQLGKFHELLTDLQDEMHRVKGVIG